MAGVVIQTPLLQFCRKSICLGALFGGGGGGGVCVEGGGGGGGGV